MASWQRCDPRAAFLDEVGAEFIETTSRMVAEQGEPFQTFLTPAEVEVLVKECGLTTIEHLTREDIHHRYFAGRDDGLTPLTAERLITARPCPLTCANPTR